MNKEAVHRILNTLYENSERNAIHIHKAGAGLGGLFVFLVLLVISIFFTVFADQYFIGMLIIAIGQFIYSCSSEIGSVLNYTLKVYKSNTHITDNANMLIDSNNQLNMVEKNYYSSIDTFDISEESNNKSALANLIVNGQAEDSEIFTNTLENFIYNDADEIYGFCINVYDSTSSMMPVYGLMGTVFGMIQTLAFISGSSSANVASIASEVSIAMKTTLYGAMFSIIFKVVAIRFKEKRSSLGYDFERMKNHIQFISNKRSEARKAQ